MRPSGQKRQGIRLHKPSSEQSDARERRSRAFRQWRVHRRRPVIGDVKPSCILPFARLDKTCRFFPQETLMDAEGNPTDECRVFLSSTWQDLKAHRAACIEVMRRLRNELNIDWVTMEEFGAVPESPRDYCRKQVARCRLYVGIFGSRYGYLDEKTGVSATELEYSEAIDAKIPCLIYIIDPGAKVPLDQVDTGSAAFQLAALKANLRDFTKGHIVQYFTSPEDLAARFAVDLVKAVRMLGSGNNPSGLRTTIEQAIAECAQFVSDMENVTTGGWSYRQVGSSTSWDTAFSLLALSATGQDVYCLNSIEDTTFYSRTEIDSVDGVLPGNRIPTRPLRWTGSSISWAFLGKRIRRPAVGDLAFS